MYTRFVTFPFEIGAFVGGGVSLYIFYRFLHIWGGCLDGNDGDDDNDDDVNSIMV